MTLPGRCFSRPGLGPAADLPFFDSSKKRRPKKDDPNVRDPPLRCGQPASWRSLRSAWDFGLAFIQSLYHSEWPPVQGLVRKNTFSQSGAASPLTRPCHVCIAGSWVYAHVPTVMDGMGLPARASARLCTCFEHPVHLLRASKRGAGGFHLTEESETMHAICPILVTVTCRARP